MATDTIHQRASRLIDLDRYPLENREAIAELIAQESRHMADEGVSILEGFLTADAVAEMLSEAQILTSQAYHSVAGGTGTVYLEAPRPEFGEGHPRRTIVPGSTVAVVAYDQFPAGSAIRELFEWDGLKDFIAAILGEKVLYRYADPLGALNLAVMGDGDELGWHFDQTDFVVSIALQPSVAGGDFESAQKVRSVDDENYGAVADILAGRDHSQVATLPMHPGTLMLFQGRYSMHRVTPVSGEVPRLVLLLAYDTKPGTVSSERLQLSRYGRRAES